MKSRRTDRDAAIQRWASGEWSAGFGRLIRFGSCP
jgi:hypothetical protein